MDLCQFADTLPALKRSPKSMIYSELAISCPMKAVV